MAMVLAVILTLVASTIALVLVQQALAGAQSASEHTGQGAADRVAEDLVAQFEDRLTEDPTFYTRELFFAERPRVCSTGETPQTIAASGDPDAPAVEWPAGCDAVWSYVPAGQKVDGYDPAARIVTAEVLPPSASNRDLRLRVLATVGESSAAVEYSYRMPPAGQLTVYSGTDLALDTLAGAAGTVQVNGTVYSLGTLSTPTRPEHTIDGVAPLTGSRLLSECAVAGPAAGESGVWSAQPAAEHRSGCTVVPDQRADTQDVRTLAPTQLSIAGQIRTTADLVAAACSDRPTVVSTTSTGTWSDHLCLRAGATLTDVAGHQVTIPGGDDAPVAYRVLPGGAPAAGTVRVLTAGSAPTEPADLAAGVAAYNAGTHPLSEPGGTWTDLGTFPAPATGALVTDATTYVGQCTGFMPGGACAAVTTPFDLTVVAGTPAAPRTLVVAGPVNATDGAHLGLVATGHLSIAAYSHAAGADLELGAYLLSLGGDGTTTVISATDPSLPGATLRITGSLGAASIGSLAGWQRVTVHAGDSLGPNRFPAFRQQWRRAAHSNLTAADLCGQPSCVASW